MTTILNIQDINLNLERNEVLYIGHCNTFWFVYSWFKFRYV